ncbi:MAG: RlmE family RNA methyltransferase [Spirochaetes bacterium]|nr:RlmE family RNA methyltransferase [Spirochaetota bacterium]
MANGKQIYTEDFYQEQARKLGLRARSYFKLEELDRKFRIVKRGQRILDLGAAPGSWSQFVLRKTLGDVHLTAIDLQEIEPFHREKVDPARVVLLKADVSDASLSLEGPFDVVLSDMAPRTMGVPSGDSALSAELVRLSMAVALKRLKAGGTLVAKYLQGAELPELQGEFRRDFASFKIFKPESSRRQSTEVFFTAWKR